MLKKFVRSASDVIFRVLGLLGSILYLEELITIFVWSAVCGGVSISLAIAGYFVPAWSTAVAITLSALFAIVFVSPRGLKVGNKCPGQSFVELADASSSISSSEIERCVEMPESVATMMIRSDSRGACFIDMRSNRLFLYGVAVSGASKGTLTNRPGVPFELSEAPKHFYRISKLLGFNLIRLVVPWEAIEPDEPGVHSEEYLTYLYELVKIAGDFGLYVILDMHQDVWSRASGGDGAPLWTLQAVGFDTNKLGACSAALIHDSNIAGKGKQPSQHMTWVTNYLLAACSTMNTVFFGGHVFCPNRRVMNFPQFANERVHEFLFRCFAQSVAVASKRLESLPNFFAVELWNEPNLGYAGIADLADVQGSYVAGLRFSPWDGLRFASGENKRVPFFNGPFQFHSMVDSNPLRVSAWSEGVHDVWREAGVWDYDSQGKAQLLKPQYFKMDDKKRELLLVDMWKRAAEFVPSSKLILGCPKVDLCNPEKPVPVSPDPSELGPNTAARFSWAPHCYDGIRICAKRRIPWLGAYPGISDGSGLCIGSSNVRAGRIKAYAKVQETARLLYPCILGEVGIHKQLEGLDSTDESLDECLSAAFSAKYDGIVVWNYTPNNMNDAQGDGWNGEDLSIVSHGGNFVRMPSAARVYLSSYSNHEACSLVCVECLNRGKALRVRLRIDRTLLSEASPFLSVHYRVPLLYSMTPVVETQLCDSGLPIGVLQNTFVYDEIHGRLSIMIDGNQFTSRHSEIGISVSLSSVLGKTSQRNSFAASTVCTVEPEQRAALTA